ncbi:MAG: molecular chaperone GrpE [Paraglaciecola sp.]|jgi:molecular chaperone GrpE
MSNEEQAQNEDAQPVMADVDATQDTGVDAEPAAEQLTPEQLRIEELEAALAASEGMVAAQKDSVIRAIADADNVRKRAQLDIDKARKFALEKFAAELLPVADNLERALQVADPANESIKPVVDGVELTLKSFISGIEKFGIEVIDPQGQLFNPELHQAMSMQENAELAPNTVMAVMQKGYVLNGRLLRPAMVMVSRAPESGVNTQA